MLTLFVLIKQRKVEYIELFCVTNVKILNFLETKFYESEAVNYL